MSLVDELDAIEAEAVRGVADAQCLEDLDRIRIAVTGKRGSLTRILRSMGDIPKDVRPALGKRCQAILNTVDYDEVVPCERDQLLQETLDDVVGLGPLQPLFDEDTITEVMVNGCESLFFEREGILHQGDRAFDTPERILMTIDRILAPLGRRLDESNPIVNARLANGYRVDAVASPIAIDGPVLTIRKFTGQIISLDRLVAL